METIGSAYHSEQGMSHSYLCMLLSFVAAHPTVALIGLPKRGPTTHPLVPEKVSSATTKHFSSRQWPPHALLCKRSRTRFRDAESAGFCSQWCKNVGKNSGSKQNHRVGSGFW